MDSLKVLSSITYIDTERFIEGGETKVVKTQYSLQLYEDTVNAATTSFNITSVWDISYKSFSDDANLLYLHTNRGVITYKVFSNPNTFVKAFKKLKNVNY